MIHVLERAVSTDDLVKVKAGCETHGTGLCGGTWGSSMSSTERLSAEMMSAVLSRMRSVNFIPQIQLIPNYILSNKFLSKIYFLFLPQIVIIIVLSLNIFNGQL